MFKEVKGLLFEISILSFIIVMSILLCPNLKEEHLKKTEAVMSYVSDLSINVVNRKEYYLFPMTDEYAINNLEKSTIKVSNYNDDNKQYSLYLKVDKNSTINVDKLNFMFNDKIIDFNETYSHQDENYVYYQVYQNNVREYDYIDYIFWLKEDSEITNVNFIYSFEVI